MLPNAINGLNNALDSQRMERFASERKEDLKRYLEAQASKSSNPRLARLESLKREPQAPGIEYSNNQGAPFRDGHRPRSNGLNQSRSHQVERVPPAPNAYDNEYQQREIDRPPVLFYDPRVNMPAPLPVVTQNVLFR